MNKTKKTYSSLILLQLTKRASKRIGKVTAWDLVFVRKLHMLYKVA